MRRCEPAEDQFGLECGQKKNKKKTISDRASQKGWFWRLLQKIIKTSLSLGPSTSSRTKTIVVLWFFKEMCSGCPLVDCLLQSRKTRKIAKNAKNVFFSPYLDTNYPSPTVVKLSNSASTIYKLARTTRNLVQCVRNPWLHHYWRS